MWAGGTPTLIFFLNIHVSLRECTIQTTEDAEYLEIAKACMWVGDQKQKYDMEWLNHHLNACMLVNVDNPYYKHSSPAWRKRAITFT